MSDGVAIVSGGLDSVTMLYHLVKHNYRPHVLSFNYAQRHAKELYFANQAAERFGLPWQAIALIDVGNEMRDSNSSLINPDVNVPEAHYPSATLTPTVLPNRHM